MLPSMDIPVSLPIDGRISRERHIEAKRARRLQPSSGADIIERNAETGSHAASSGKVELIVTLLMVVRFGYSWFPLVDSECSCTNDGSDSYLLRHSPSHDVGFSFIFISPPRLSRWQLLRPIRGWFFICGP